LWIREVWFEVLAATGIVGDTACDRRRLPACATDGLAPEMLCHFADRATEIPVVDPHQQRQSVGEKAAGVANATTGFIDVRKNPKAILSTMDRTRDMLSSPLHSLI
jgi:hypothetical protein